MAPTTSLAGDPGIGRKQSAARPRVVVSQGSVYIPLQPPHGAGAPGWAVWRRRASTVRWHAGLPECRRLSLRSRLFYEVPNATLHGSPRRAGITAEQVAQAHQADIGAAAKFGVTVPRVLVRCRSRGGILPGESTRGRRSLTAVHKETHGLIPNEIISVSEDDVLRFLGRMNEAGDDSGGSPPSGRSSSPICGSTSILQEVGQAAFMVLLTSTT